MVCTRLEGERGMVCVMDTSSVSAFYATTPQLLGEGRRIEKKRKCLFFLASKDAFFSLLVLPGRSGKCSHVVFCGDPVDSSEGNVEPHNHNFLMREIDHLLAASSRGEESELWAFLL